MADSIELVGEDLRGHRLKYLKVSNSRLQRCRFDGMRVASASFGAGRAMSTYVDCTFDGARLEMAAGGYARFEGCSFQDVDIREWFCFTVELVSCVFSGTLRRSVFNGTVPADRVGAIGRSRNDFHGNDFSNLRMLDVAFRTGVDLTAQVLPLGPDYLYVSDAAGATRRAREVVATWDDLDLRREALVMLRVLEGDVEQGQAQFLLRADDYPKRVRPAIDALFALLV